MIFRAKSKSNFTIIPNKTINDERLSLRAKGLLMYLLSKPDNWNVNLVHLASVCNEGKTAIRSALNELIEAGFIQRKQLRNDSGLMTGYQYDVYDTAKSTVVRKTDDGKPASGKPDAGNRTLISTDSNKNIETSTTNVVEPKAQGNEEINSIIKSFEAIFGIEQPSAQRRPAQWLRQKYGVTQTEAMFRKVADAQANDQFCPRTPTVKDFHYAIPKLQDYFKRIDSKKQVEDGGLSWD